MEKQYFESFDNKKIPYLFFESKKQKYKNNVVIFIQTFALSIMLVVDWW